MQCSQNIISNLKQLTPGNKIIEVVLGLQKNNTFSLKIIPVGPKVGHFPRSFKEIHWNSLK